MSEYCEDTLLLPHALRKQPLTIKHDVWCSVYCRLTPQIGIKVLKIETITPACNLKRF